SVEAACMIDANHLAFTREGTLRSGGTRLLPQTPRFDHCNMTLGPSASLEVAARVRELLLWMSYADAELPSLFHLDDIKTWSEGRTAGYAPLEAAVDALDFYDREGRIDARDYRP